MGEKEKAFCDLMIYWFYCVVMAIFLEPHKTLTAIVKLTQYKHDPDLDPRFNPPQKTTEILHSKLWKSTTRALFLFFFFSKLPSLVALFNNLFSQCSAFCLHSVTFLSIHKGAVSEQTLWVCRFSITLLPSPAKAFVRCGVASEMEGDRCYVAELDTANMYL